MSTAGKLAVLAEPYPQAVVSTPNSWSFDHSTFQLSYATARADGVGSFAAGAQTNISVPPVQYPNGYQVVVTGGHVMSAPNAPVLVIASDSRRHHRQRDRDCCRRQRGETVQRSSVATIPAR